MLCDIEHRKYLLVINQAHPILTRKEDFITEDSVDSFVLKHAPDFLDYLFFHNLTDKLCFIAKAHYSDRDTVKRRKYRLDLLFQRYLLDNNASRRNPERQASTESQRDRIRFHLSKAWYNELVRSDPLLPDYLEIGVQLSGWHGPGSGGLVAWNVIQSYYAIFEFFSALTAVFLPDTIIDGHLKLSRNFNSQVLGKASKTDLFYPFNLTSHTRESQLPKPPKHSHFHYASYPREPGKSTSDLDREIIRAYQFMGEGRDASVIDLLYRFRLWANYTGVTTILKLTDGGYLGFLMKNLATLVFFAGGAAEIAALRILGESRYLSLLRKFHVDFVERHERFARNKFLIPAYVRLRVYKHIGLIRRNTPFVYPDTGDPIRFVER